MVARRIRRLPGAESVGFFPEVISTHQRRPMPVLVIAVCAISLSCSRPDRRAADETAIRAASREWNNAETAKDLQKCLSFYAEDGERFATGSPLIAGAAALRKEWEKYLA